MGSSRKDLKKFPKRVRSRIGALLYDVQSGKKPKQAKPLNGFGSGVWEIVSDYDSDTYRAVYTVRLVHGVYVLHCFQKKSKHGIKTPQKEVDLIRQRLKQAIEQDKNTKE
jgi:phage-related protein